MPSKALRPCAEPGCAELVEGRYCTAHRSQYHRVRDARRGSSGERGYGAQWRKIRLRVLSSKPVCVDPFAFHADDSVVVLADEVDHIIPKAAGGTDDDSNLQPLCQTCHDYKTEHLDNPSTATRYARSLIPITIVSGSPGSGKKTYVGERSAWGDLIIDLDLITVALSGLPLYDKPDVLQPIVLHVRDALLRRLSRPSSIRKCWLITSDARADAVDELAHELGAQLVNIEATQSECILRISHDVQRKDRWQQWQPIVARWFSKRQANYVKNSRDRLFNSLQP